MLSLLDPSTTTHTQLGPYFVFDRAAVMSDICRNDEWNSDRPSEERKYDGPAGMDPDGVIDSNWEEVSLRLHIFF